MEKMTITQNFDLVINFVKANGGPQEMVDFLVDRQTKSQKKSSGVSVKVAKERADFDDVVLSALATNPQTVTEVFASMGYPDGVSTSKITSALGRLVRNGKATNTKDKGKSYYALA